MVKAELLREQDAAEFLSVSRIWLRKSRMTRNINGKVDAPPYVRFGRSVRYAVPDLLEFIALHRCKMNPSGNE